MRLSVSPPVKQMPNSFSRLATAPGSQKGSQRQYVPPAISLERPKARNYQKNDVLSLKLRSNPANADSQTYELTVPFFRSGTPEEWLIVKRGIIKIMTGQNITTGPGQYAMSRRILDGDALARFNAKATELGNETVANHTTCLNAVTEHVFPQRALQYQRRYMRRYLRKPAGMTTREFNARLQELNAYLDEFPPFGGNAQRLADDDLSEVLEFAIPNSWQRTMVLQGFNASERSTTDIVEFCERLEFTETLSGDINPGKIFQADSKSSKKHGKSQGKTSDEATINKKRKTHKYCPLHDTNGHDISECKVLLNQAKKMRDSWQSKTPEARRKTRKDQQEVNAAMQEFAKALKDGRITKKKRKRADGSTYEVFNVGDDFRQLTMRAADDDSDASADGPDI